MLALFLFFPFLVFLFSLKDLTKRSNAIIFILFYALFGYSNHFQLTTSDIHRIGLYFQYYDTDLNILEAYRAGELTDMYMWFACSFIRPFTENPKIYVGLLGLVYGILSYKVFSRIYINWKRPKNYLFYTLVLLSLSIISLVHFTGIRFVTGAMLFIYSVYQLLIHKKYIWIIGILSAPLIHFGMWFVVIVFGLYLLIRPILSKKAALIKIILAITFAFSFTNIATSFNQFIISNEDEIENAAITGKLKTYSSEEDHEGPADAGTAYRQANDLFTKVFKFINRIGIFLVLWAIASRVHVFRQSREAWSLYVFIALLVATGFVGFGVTDSASRYFNIAWCLIFIYISLIYDNNCQFRIFRYIPLLLFFNFYHIAFLFFNAPRLVDFELWYSPLPLLIYNNLNFYIV